MPTIPSSFVKSTTIPTTISDHYTVTADIFIRGSSVLPQNTTAISKYRNLGEIKGEKAPNFLFLLQNKLQRIPDEVDINHKVELLAKTMMECVETFAPKKNIALNKRPPEWITNHIKRAITKRDKLFQKWIDDLNETNRSAYRKQRNEVPQKIRAAKRDANLKKSPTNSNDNLQHIEATKATTTYHPTDTKFRNIEQLFYFNRSGFIF